MEIKTFRDLIKQWGATQLADDLEVSVWVVDKWRQADFIPVRSKDARYWARILNLKRSRKIKISANDLVRMSGEEQ